MIPYFVCRQNFRSQDLKDKEFALFETSARAIYSLILNLRLATASLLSGAGTYLHSILGGNGTDTVRLEL